MFEVKYFLINFYIFCRPGAEKSRNTPPVRDVSHIMSLMHRSEEYSPRMNVTMRTA